MYENFYKFSEAPFGLSPDPRFLYMAPSHFEAYSAMLSGIRERKGITIITGPPGVTALFCQKIVSTGLGY